MSFPYVDHATEGSATACAILRMLNRYPGGCSVADLYRVTGIDIAALRDALAGLRQRHRVPVIMPSMAALSLQIADRAVIGDIESEGTKLTGDDPNAGYWDISAMLNPNEQPPEVIDMNTQAIEYALERGLVRSHDVRPNLLRIVRYPT